jgi:hypothetical protein
LYNFISASLTGRLFGELQANPILHIIVANLFIIFGLVMQKALGCGLILVGQYFIFRAGTLLY